MKQTDTAGPQVKLPTMPPPPPGAGGYMAPGTMPQQIPQPGVNQPGMNPQGQPMPGYPQQGQGMDRPAMTQALSRVGQPQAQTPPVQSIGRFGYPPMTPSGPPAGIPGQGMAPPMRR